MKLAGHVTAEKAKNLIAFSTLFEDRVEEGMVITLTSKRLKIHERATAISFADFVRERFH